MTAVIDAPRIPTAPRRRKRSRRYCSFPSCDRPHKANGWCDGHNQQNHRGKELTPLVTLPKYAWTYVVYWPDALGPGLGVLKVGRSWSRWRVQRMLQTGAELISNTGNTDGTWERWALRFLAVEYPPAFTSADEASELLYRGRGWTECFAVAENQVYEAMDLCIYGYSYGNERGTNPPSAYLRGNDDQDAPQGEGEQHAPHPTTPLEEEAPVCSMNDDARVTARALWLMTDDFGRRRIDLDELAAKIRPFDDRATAMGEIALHVIMLEDAGLLETYVTDDGEWLRLLHPLPGPQTSSQRAAEQSWDAYSSTASGGERARARERAQASARERVRAERAGAERAWEDVRTRSAPPDDDPRPPASIDAPPLGCSDHPRGALFPCGPCGTARRQYDAFMDARRYENQLADRDFWRRAGEPAGDDQPF